MRLIVPPPLLLPLLLLLLPSSARGSAAPAQQPAANGSGADGPVLLWGPSWSRVAPPVPLRGIAVGSSTGQGEFPVWENFARTPRAVEPLLLSKPRPADALASAGSGAAAVFFADTGGSLFMLEPGKAVHELIPRGDGAQKSVDNSILSLAYEPKTQRLYFTANTSLMYLPLSADGSKAAGKPVQVADFAPRGVQSLVVDWSDSPTAYFCLFDNINRTSGSLVRAPLGNPHKSQILVNTTLSVMSGRPFGDSLPRFVLDLPTSRLYFVIHAVGVSWIDLTDPSASPVRVPMVTGFSPSNPLVVLSLMLLPPLPRSQSTPTLVISTIAGTIGVVPVTGGAVAWLSSPCVPTGGCSFRELLSPLPAEAPGQLPDFHPLAGTLRFIKPSHAGQLWDMKLLASSPIPMEPSESPSPSAAVFSILAPWISVTDLDTSTATIQVRAHHHRPLRKQPCYPLMTSVWNCRARR